jgi:hypothetical protein
LSGNQILGDAPADLTTYGLASPALTINVKGADGVLIGTIRVGTSTPNPPTTEYAVKREDDPTVFQLRASQFNQLDKKPADFVAGAPPAPGEIDLGDGLDAQFEP